MLMQDGQAVPPVPGEAPTNSTPANTGTTAAPSGTPSGGSGQQSPFGGQFLIMVMVLVALMLVFSMTSTRREKKKREALLSAIKKHDRVQTIGGVIGSVVEVKPDYVVLKVDESSNTRITFARSAIQQVITTSPEPAAAKTDGE